MEKKELMSILNMLPNEVRCDVHGEYNGLGGECNVDVWCGKYLRHGWKKEFDRNPSLDIGYVIEHYVCDNWSNVSDCVLEHNMDRFDQVISKAKEALNVDWDKKILTEIHNYIDNKPTNRQIMFAKDIKHWLGLNDVFRNDMTKMDYDKFIKSHIDEYKRLMEKNLNDISGFGG